MKKFILVLLLALPILSSGQITLLDPFGGEVYQSGSEIHINWDTELTANLDIKFSSDGGANWELIESDVDASLGMLLWTVPEMAIMEKLLEQH